MENIDLLAHRLYWGMIWAMLGTAITPLIFDRHNRSPWIGALTGLIVGLVSGQIFGWLLLAIGVEILPDYATYLSFLGGAVLLIPLWVAVKPGAENIYKQRGIVAGAISPLVFYLVVLSAFPLIWAILLAFFDYSPRREGGPILGLGGDNPFVGLDYFKEMVEGTSRDARSFRNTISNTLIFAAVVLPLNFAITLPLAILIESVHERLKALFRALYFLPVVTSSVGVAVMWGYIFNAQYGLLNKGLKAVGETPVAWLQDPSVEYFGIPAALLAVIIAYLWQDYGYNLVIFIAAIQGIPDSLKDAARVDGANPFQVFWHVTIPLLRPTILFTSVFTMISSFQVFDIIQVMTQGGPGRIGKTDVMVLEIYENAFRYDKMGWAAAMSLVLFVFIITITTVQMRVLRSDWEY
ncbi:MAG: sugar ABC transporter permease [Anaerolineae bacterium]|nr:sugar ABC transporter permease [Anaerolineae bacterium]